MKGVGLQRLRVQTGVGLRFRNLDCVKKWSTFEHENSKMVVSNVVGFRSKRDGGEVGG